MRDFRDAKAMAQTLRESLAAKTVSISHSESLELVSRMLGAADWNTLSAMLPDRRGKTAEPPAEPTDEIERLRAEQALPRTAVPFEPEDFDRYAGFYELRPGLIFTFTRDGGRFFGQLPGQPKVEVFPESPTKFFAKVVAAQETFVTDASGRVSGLIHHQNGREQHAPRIDAAKAEAVQAALEARFESQVRDPGSEAALRRNIEGLLAGAPCYDEMSPGLADATREQQPRLQATFADVGPLRSIAFVGVNKMGFDVYNAWFENGVQHWHIRMGQDERIEGAFFGPGP